MASNRAKFVIKQGRNGKYHWQLIVRGKPVAQSFNGFSSPRHARAAIESVKNHSATAAMPE